MLKTQRNGKTWLVSQPDHGAVAGFLAAHWGNDDFAQPGRLQAPDGGRLRSEIVVAIAEHDNGWWEWVAQPEMSDVDGLPLDLRDVLKRQQEGMDRWRLGIPRLSRRHPYASLLISCHAYLSYAARISSSLEPERVHPLFGKGAPAKLMAGSLKRAQDFLTELEAQQEELRARLQQNATTRAWIEPENLMPAVRLLQILDGLSLALSSPLVPPVTGKSAGMGADAIDLLEVPRKSWRDRVTIQVRPIGERQLTLDPYPFAEERIKVTVPVRVIDDERPPETPVEVWWRGQQPELLSFELMANARPGGRKPGHPKSLDPGD